MNKLSVKAIISTLLIIVFLLLALSGGMLHFATTGLVWGFTRHFLREFHFWIAVAMCALVLAHFLLNIRLFGSEVRSIFRKKGSKDENTKTVDSKESTDSTEAK